VLYGDGNFIGMNSLWFKAGFHCSVPLPCLFLDLLMRSGGTQQAWVNEKTPARGLSHEASRAANSSRRHRPFLTLPPAAPLPERGRRGLWERRQRSLPLLPTDLGGCGVLAPEEAHQPPPPRGGASCSHWI
jgi:hypothetical protein